MKNITDYNQFVKLNKWNRITEEMDIDTGGYGKGADSPGNNDLYFANVKGNLAGAENTLVGAAALKLFGFIKRKGLQMYMKKVLKPRLGRVYMNGILRYANKEGIGNFARKKFFEINKIEENKAVEYNDEVTFKLEGVNGLGAFKKGAEVIKKDNNPLEDGEYILKENDGKFSVSGGKIIKIEEGFETKNIEIGETGKTDETTEDGIVDTNISDDEFTEYKNKIKEDLIDMEKNGVTPEKWVIDECNNIKSKIEINVSQIDEEDIQLIKTERASLLSGVKILNEGIKDINSILEKGKDNVPNYDDVRVQKLVFTANMNELLKLADYLGKIIATYNSKLKKPEVKTSEVKTGEVKVVPTKESHLYEAEAPVVVDDKKLKKQNIAPTKVGGKLNIKTNRLGDELQEIAKSGDVIDLNDEEFYKQFESDERRAGVTTEILKNKPAIAKIQLDAERIIGGNEKQQNAWNKMVENVKAMYSKYMNTDQVDPAKILKGIPDVETLKKENAKSKDGQNVKSVVVRSQLDTIPLWDDNTDVQKNLGKGLVNNDYICTKLTMDGVTNNYIVQKVKEINGLSYYRVLGLIDLDKIIESKEEYTNGNKKDFSDSVKIGVFSDIIGPVKPVRDGGKIVAVYIVRDKPLQFGNNTDVSLLYLYSTSSTGGVNFDNATTFYTIKKKGKDKAEVKLPNSPLSKKEYTNSLEIYALGTWKITYPDSAFGIDTNQKFDISKESSVKKMGGIETIYEVKK